MKNILHFSTVDYGGAGSATHRFHENLKKNGFNSKILVLNKRTNDTDVITIGQQELKLFGMRLLNRVNIRLKLFEEKYNFYGHWKSAIKNIEMIENLVSFKPDIIVLHWISGLIDLEVVQKLQKKYNCKVYWYLMDMAPMTGGCHYAWECDGYKNNCSDCPAVMWPYSNLPYNNLSYKINILNKLDLEIISGTGWLEKQLQKSSVFKNKKIHNIMLGIDENIFKPLNMNEIRKIKNKFSLPNDKKIIFFGASSIKDKRKGLQFLIKSLELLSEDENFNNENILIVTAGNLKDDSVFKNILIEHKHIGFLNGLLELAQAYQIADVFVSSSIEDSGPMMINESIMCGTPIVSFDMGVASDLVINNKTGYLAKLKDINDLAYGIKKIITMDSENYIKMRKNCRDTALQKTGEKVQVEKFIKIIEK